MAEILDVVTAFFQADDWPFTHFDETTLRTGFQGDGGNWNCYARVHEEQDRFVFYSICPVNVPEEKRPAMAEFLTRANYGLLVGNFEMDFSDGEMRFKTSIDVEGDELSQALVKSLVYTNVLMMDRYLPGIMKVIYSDISPEAAVIEVESG